MYQFINFLNRILSTPKIFILFLFVWFVIGLFSVYSFYVAGVIIYLVVAASLLVILYIAILRDKGEARDIHRVIQCIFVIIAFIFIFMTLKYYTSITQMKPVAWEPIYFQYGESNSKDGPCDNFFSGKLEGGQPLKLSGTLGFGFCRDDRTDPIYQTVQKQLFFVIQYFLERDVLIAATFEGLNDVDLTKPFAFILRETASGKKVIDLNEFEWIDDQSKIKHLKFNFIVIPNEDLILVKFLLFVGMDSWLNGTYLIP